MLAKQRSSVQDVYQTRTRYLHGEKKSQVGYVKRTNHITSDRKENMGKAKTMQIKLTPRSVYGYKTMRKVADKYPDDYAKYCTIVAYLLHRYDRTHTQG